MQRPIKPAWITEKLDETQHTLRMMHAQDLTLVRQDIDAKARVLAQLAVLEMYVRKIQDKIRDVA